ncbi:MAG: hypothetical protein HPY55_04755 [Firmicutes bacterium]|nr:hypothetical protein [Bacillota bacterium]
MKQRYLLFQKAEGALIEEKAQKLFGITRLLEKHLEGEFDDILNRLTPKPAGRKDKIQALNRELAPYTDMVAACFPGVGVGYYSRDLGCILTYGPSSEFGSKVGVSAGPGHIGVQAMELGREVVGVGSMVRGEIMNCVSPIIRCGRAVGFVWANETLADIYAQIQQGARSLFFSPNIQPILGLTGLLLFASRSLLMPARLPESILASMETRRHNRRQDRVALLPYVQSIKRMFRYLMMFLNSLSLGVLVADEQGQVVFASDGLLEIVQRKRNDIMEMSCPAFLESIGLDPANVLGVDAEAMNRFSNMSIKIPSGPKDVTMISTHVSEGVGGRDGYIVLFEDLEEARAEEERVQRTEKLAAMGELAASIAHEIRNPLTIVAGSIQLIPQKLGDQEFLVNSSRILGEELARVNRTVESLLNFTRFSKPRYIPVELNQVVERSVDVIRAYARAALVNVVEEYAETLPPVEGDPEHLQQAFLNLLLNAIQAMPDGGVLKVSTSRQPGSAYVQVSLRDTGVGIPEKDQDKIFDMFYSTKKDGTGLGLALVQRIVDEHKGYIEFNSRAGEGACFNVNLPAQHVVLKFTE